MKRVLRTRGLRIAVVLLTGVVTSAHYGSRGIIYEGSAGPYQIAALIEPPRVIPAPASVLVEVSGSLPDSVTVQPVRYGLENANAPAPYRLPRGTEAAQRFRGGVWLMTLGSYRFRVTVHGDRGEGTAVIPVPAILTAKPAWGTGSTLVLLVLGVGLVGGTLLVMKAIARDGMRSPGAPRTAADYRSARRTGRAGVMAWAGISGIIAVWWLQMGAGYDVRIFQPYRWNLSLTTEAGNRELVIRLEDPRWNRPSARLVPDDGYPLHLFLIRSPALDVFAHLHPGSIDSLSYRTVLPPLPAGSYRVFGDVVHADGIPQTLVDTLVVDNSLNLQWRPSSPDDSWWRDSVSSTMAGLHWMAPRHPLKAGNPSTLSFTVTDAEGFPTPHQPLMGMDGHAVVLREDLSVFAHLHPMGTVSMAAMERLAENDRVNIRHVMAAGKPGTAPVGFPWVFPVAGRYRIWGQTRSAGAIVTGMQDLVVEEAQ